MRMSMKTAMILCVVVGSIAGAGTAFALPYPADYKVTNQMDTYDANNTAGHVHMTHSRARPELGTAAANGEAAFDLQEQLTAGANR